MIKTPNAAVSKALKRLHYPLDVMLTCVRWYVAYPLSLRPLEEMMSNWLRVFSALEFAYKPQQERVFVDTIEPVRIPLLWCSRWRNASHGKGFQRI